MLVTINLPDKTRAVFVHPHLIVVRTSSGYLPAWKTRRPRFRRAARCCGLNTLGFRSITDPSSGIERSVSTSAILSLLTNQCAAIFKSQRRDPIVEFRSFSFGLVCAPCPQCKLTFTSHTHSTNTLVAHPCYGRRKPSEISSMGTSTTTTTTLSLTTILNLTG